VSTSAGFVRRPDRETLFSEIPFMTTYNVKIRFNGVVSWTTVQANSAGQAKQLVLAQYGGAVDVLSVQRA
jgi:hypothetical protein